MKITCPKCGSDNIISVNNSHYICNNQSCMKRNGTKVQFKIVYDKGIKFPYNQIFVDRSEKEFFNKPYLVI
jgi:hypothetical protein